MFPTQGVMNAQNLRLTRHWRHWRHWSVCEVMFQQARVMGRWKMIPSHAFLFVPWVHLPFVDKYLRRAPTHVPTPGWSCGVTRTRHWHRDSLVSSTRTRGDWRMMIPTRTNAFCQVAVWQRDSGWGVVMPTHCGFPQPGVAESEWTVSLKNLLHFSSIF